MIGNDNGGRHACLALVHHANQYVITNGYSDRQGMNDILGLSNPLWGRDVHRKGFLPLLQMHLDYGIPLNLHLSGTLIETLAWHYPESFLLIKRLLKEGNLEMIGSTFSQNIMPFFSEEYNLRQINEELWLYRRYLGVDLEKVKTFWVPERVWDTEKLASVLTSDKLLNGGYRRVLLDDRMTYPGGYEYSGSARERFDREGCWDLEAFTPREIDGGCGLLMLPISKDLRLNIPPCNPGSWQRIRDILNWLAHYGDEKAIALYGDDLERAAGVGGWEISHSEYYEQFLKWLADTRWIKPMLVSQWAQYHHAAGARKIEPGTFYELAQQWGAGETYHGWYEDPNCQAHRNYLINAEQAVLSAEQDGGDKSLLELGWKHLLHSSYETSWHNRAEEGYHYQENGRSLWLAPWAAALTSHARSCLVIVLAARWHTDRDGQGHIDIADVDGDGENELVLKNDHLFAVLSPRRGGRLNYLFDLSDPSGGRLMVGNISDDWNLQEELNRYMDCPRNHPGALADVGHEHDQYEIVRAETCGLDATVTLRNVESGSPLYGLEKSFELLAKAGHLCVNYTIPPELWRVSTEICLSPDYYKLLRDNRRGLAVYNGPDWKGWSNGAARAWVRIDRTQSTIWDRPYQNECGHGLNLRVTSFSREFHLELGVGTPPERTCQSKPCLSDAIEPEPQPAFHLWNAKERVVGPRLRQARKGWGYADDGAAERTSLEHQSSPSEEVVEQILRITDPHFMRRLFNNSLQDLHLHWSKASACRIRILKPHHNKLTLEYNLQCTDEKKNNLFPHDLVGSWRQDNRNSELNGLLTQLWQAGFGKPHDLTIARVFGYWERLHLLVREKAPGKHLRDWIYYPDADWTGPMRNVAAWLSRLHNTDIKTARHFTVDSEVQALSGWLSDMLDCPDTWIAHEKERIRETMEELILKISSLHLADLRLTHGDFHPENIFVRRNTITVIDFEHTVMGDPAFDLGYLLAEIDIQSDRYWSTRGVTSAVDIEQIQEVLFEEYASKRSADVLKMVPLYCARTYLRHLMHTVRMKGNEDPRLVTLWLDKAAASLTELRSASVAPGSPVLNELSRAIA